MNLNSTVDAVTDRIRERSRAGRDAYLDRCRVATARKPRRGTLSCGNLAHGFAACGASEKSDLAGTTTANIAIVSSYNDMLSAHQPYETFPPLIGSVRSRGSLPRAPPADRFSVPLFERSRERPWIARIATRRRPMSVRIEQFMATGVSGAGIAGGGSTSGPARC